MHYSNPEHQEKETEHLENIFQQCGYPCKFITKCLTAQFIIAQPTQTMRRIIFPYIKNISETTNRLLEALSIIAAYKPTKVNQNTSSKPTWVNSYNIKCCLFVTVTMYNRQAEEQHNTFMNIKQSEGTMKIP